MSDTISRHSNQFNSIEKTEENSTPQTMKRVPVPVVAETSAGIASSDDDDDDEQPRRGESEKQQVGHFSGKRNSNTKFPFGTALPSPLGSAHSFDIQVRSE